MQHAPRLSTLPARAQTAHPSRQGVAEAHPVHVLVAAAQDVPDGVAVLGCEEKNTLGLQHAAYLVEKSLLRFHRTQPPFASPAPLKNQVCYHKVETSVCVRKAAVVSSARHKYVLEARLNTTLSDKFSLSWNHLQCMNDPRLLCKSYRMLAQTGANLQDT